MIVSGKRVNPKLDIQFAEDLPYPCLLEYSNENCHYVILAYNGRGTSIYGIVVKVFYDSNSPDEAIHVGDCKDIFVFENFGTPAGFNFYNESVIISNKTNYTL